MAEFGAETAQAAEPEVSCDTILNGQISLRQPRKGHRAGTDAVLLAAAAPAEVSGLVLDIGSGVGTAGLILAARCPKVSLGLIENDPLAASLARENLALNGLAERALVHEADIFSSVSRRAAGLTPGRAAVVLTNPPFGDPDRHRGSPDPGKRNAHLMPASGHGLLAAWIRASLALLSPGGTFILIHRPDALPDILAACGQKIGDVTILPVHPQKDKAAHRMLLRGRKGSKAPFSIAPPLVLQEAGHFTLQAEAIHRGEALIVW